MPHVAAVLVRCRVTRLACRAHHACAVALMGMRSHSRRPARVRNALAARLVKHVQTNRVAARRALDVRVRKQGAAEDRWRRGGIGVSEGEDEVERRRLGLEPEVDVPLEEVILKWCSLRSRSLTQ